MLEGSFAQQKVHRSNDRETVKLLLSTTNRLKNAIENLTKALDSTDRATYVLEKEWDRMKPKMKTLMVRTNFSLVALFGFSPNFLFDEQTHKNGHKNSRQL